jgi:hypothetical protein
MFVSAGDGNGDHGDDISLPATRRIFSQANFFPLCVFQETARARFNFNCTSGVVVPRFHPERTSGLGNMLIARASKRVIPTTGRRRLIAGNAVNGETC